MVAASVEAPRKVVCPGCGDVRWVPAHNARHLARTGQPGLCTRCRFPPRPLSDEDHDALCRWWLDRYSDEELAALAHAFGVEEACAKNVASARRLFAERRTTASGGLV